MTWVPDWATAQRVLLALGLWYCLVALQQIAGALIVIADKLPAPRGKR